MWGAHLYLLVVSDKLNVNTIGNLAPYCDTPTEDCNTRTGALSSWGPHGSDC
jgi:hypothetical protein